MNAFRAGDLMRSCLEQAHAVLDETTNHAPLFVQRAQDRYFISTFDRRMEFEARHDWNDPRFFVFYVGRIL
jgi:hypothetical protein